MHNAFHESNKKIYQITEMRSTSNTSQASGRGEIYREHTDDDFFVGVSRDPWSCIQSLRWPALWSDSITRNSESSREHWSDVRLPAAGFFGYGNGLCKRIDKF